VRLLLYAFLALFVALAFPGQHKAKAQTAQLEFTVDRSERKLYVRRGEAVIQTAPVAVGKPGHATPTGSWEFTQVDINPDWTPPNSDWSRDASYTPPGHPDNPMGRARLNYNRPYTIHGTEALHSLGTAASHGSIRVSNRVAIELAELLLREGGSWQGQEWFVGMLANPTRMYEIPLVTPKLIRVLP
jgi:lipoprotein-anchoring transpeptidase ErfK/SrfK